MGVARKGAGASQGASAAEAGRAGPGRGLGQAARVANIILGAWLFASAFVWPHAQASRVHTWIAGLLMVVIGAGALWLQPLMRYLNTVLSFWLFFTSLSALQTRRATLWNNLIASALVFLLSLVPSRPLSRSKGFAEA